MTRKNKKPLKAALFKITYLVAAALIIMQFSQCKDDDNPDKNNPESPKITVDVNSPATGTSYSYGDTVWIKLEIIGEHDLHEYSVVLNNVSVMEKVFDYSGHVHTHNKAHADTFWVNNVQQHSDMEMVVSASDHEGNILKDTTEFHCHPQM